MQSYQTFMSYSLNVINKTATAPKHHGGVEGSADKTLAPAGPKPIASCCGHLTAEEHKIRRWEVRIRYRFAGKETKPD